MDRSEIQFPSRVIAGFNSQKLTTTNANKWLQNPKIEKDNHFEFPETVHTNFLFHEKDLSSIEGKNKQTF